MDIMREAGAIGLVCQQRTVGLGNQGGVAGKQHPRFEHFESEFAVWMRLGVAGQATANPGFGRLTLQAIPQPAQQLIPLSTAKRSTQKLGFAQLVGNFAG